MTPPPLEEGESFSAGGGGGGGHESAGFRHQQYDQEFAPQQHHVPSKQRSRKGKEKMPIYEESVPVPHEKMYTTGGKTALIDESFHQQYRSHHQHSDWNKLLFDRQKEIERKGKEEEEEEEMIHRQIESRMVTYHFKVLNPQTYIATPVGTPGGNAHGREHYLGHPSNAAVFSRNIQERWPLSHTFLPDSNEGRRKSTAERNLYKSQQVIRYLQNNPNRGIFHVQSGNIYLNNIGSEQDAYYQHATRRLSKLRYDQEGRIHFKMSDMAKFHRRHPASPHQPSDGVTRISGRSMEEETSSEEEEVAEQQPRQQHARIEHQEKKDQNLDLGSGTVPAASRRPRSKRRSRLAPDQQQQQQ